MTQTPRKCKLARNTVETWQPQNRTCRTCSNTTDYQTKAAMPLSASIKPISLKSEQCLIPIIFTSKENGIQVAKKKKNLIRQKDLSTITEVTLTSWISWKLTTEEISALLLIQLNMGHYCLLVIHKLNLQSTVAITSLHPVWKDSMINNRALTRQLFSRKILFHGK